MEIKTLKQWADDDRVPFLVATLQKACREGRLVHSKPNGSKTILVTWEAMKKYLGV